MFCETDEKPAIIIVRDDNASATLPANYFHLAHARFVLIHTPAYQKALTNIFRALRPGGWLVLAEPDFSAARVVAGTKLVSQSLERVHQVIIKMFENAGLNPAFGLELPNLLQQFSMSYLTVENETPISQGGSSLATIMKLSAYQLKNAYLATGIITQPDITRYTRFTDNPKSWAIYHGTVAVSASKSLRESSEVQAIQDVMLGRTPDEEKGCFRRCMILIHSVW